jgi:phospholipid-binding lipoprotein MlaA
MQKRRFFSVAAFCVVSMLGLGLLTVSSAFAQNGAFQGGLTGPLDTLDATTPAYEPSVFEPFNEKMFSFNIWMDEHILRPVARSYAGAVPENARLGVRRFFDNISVVPRFANSLFQLKLNGAAREAGRFMINTTIGGLGFFDIAKEKFGIEKSEEDFGQTLGKYGVRPGPYLVLPFIGPSTLRDAIGRVADGAMDPRSYFLSPTEIVATDAGTTGTDAVNERSLNLELFESVNRFSLDLYSAVQDFYLQNRERQVAE